MKKQRFYHFLFLNLICCLSLSACPQSETPPPPDIPLEKVAKFPQEHVNCCWKDLVTSDAKYEALVLDAFNGSSVALSQLLKLSDKLELTASYAHGTVLADILNRVGDAHFAGILVYVSQKEAFKGKNDKLEETFEDTLRNILEGGFPLNLEPALHTKSLADFPQTAKVLNYQVEGKVAAPVEAPAKAGSSAP